MDLGTLALIGTILTVVGGILAVLTKTLDFQDAIKRLIRGWQGTFTKWRRGHKDLLTRYLNHELKEILASNTPGSTKLTVRDLLESEDVFISPGWTYYPPEDAELAGQRSNSAGEKLQDYLVAKLLAADRVLLLSDPGQGKSTILKRVFFVLAHRFIEKKSAVVPLYIPCRDLNVDPVVPIKLDDLHQYLYTRHNPLALSLEEFRTAARNKLLVFLFDGFDEIRGELNQAAINQRVNSDIFLHPGVLACRTHFYEFHLSYSPLDRSFPNKVCLLPLEHDAVEQYISRVCCRQQKQMLSATISGEIHGDSKLGDLSRQMLLLEMITDIYTSGSELQKGPRNTAKLYDEYVRLWLKNEASKPLSSLGWHQKAELLEEVAWEIFTAKLPSTMPYGDTQKVTISRPEIGVLFDELNAPSRYAAELAEIVDDICSHSCLDATGENYHFAHRSFHEYFVARFVIRSIQKDRERTWKVMNRQLPMEIANFFKEKLQLLGANRDKVEIMANNLIDAYGAGVGDDSREALAVREQAGYYLGRLTIERVATFLEGAIRNEPNKWVKRGMIVGLIYGFQRADVLNGYIESLHCDAEADAYNLGYHLEYYGDQPPAGDHIYGNFPRCDRTVRSILRHLESGRAHQIGWALDLLTLRRLLSKVGRERRILSEENMQFLGDFLCNTARGDPIFETERQALIHELQEQNLL